MKYVAIVFIIAAIFATMFYAATRPPKVKVDLSPAPAMTTWDLPSCPREITLQDGSRWSPPTWSDAGCKASIIWMQQ
jgi:hypothetical protein